MPDEPAYSDTGAAPFGPAGFASFRAARQRYLATMTEATLIARLEASWATPWGDDDEGTDRDADA